jgi:hypothetical protein
MRKLQKVNLSAALIVVLCFFLPWVQVSCGGARDTLGGIDLARDTHHELWLIPVLMLAVIFINVARPWREMVTLSAVVSLIGGLISAYLMNRERIRANDDSALLAVRLTGWFWLGFASAFAISITAVVRLFRDER